MATSSAPATGAAWTGLDRRGQRLPSARAFEHHDPVKRIGHVPELDRLTTFADILGELDRWRVASRNSGKVRITLRELAAVTGVPRSSLANYLSGKTLIPPDALDAVVLALGATPAQARQWAEAWERAMASAAPPSLSQHSMIPRQLPADVSHFVGRSAELAMMDDVLHLADGKDAAVIAITGTAGVGKTALAVRWGRRTADRFPDGHLYV